MQMECLELQSNLRQGKVRLEGDQPCKAPENLSRSHACRIITLILFHTPLVKTQIAFHKLGKVISRYPIHVVFLLILAVGLCCLGFLRNPKKEPTKEIFTTNSEAEIKVKEARKLFKVDNQHLEEIIVSVLPGRNDILTRPCLIEMIFIHQTVINISDYKHLCVKPDLVEQKCVSSNPLQLNHFQNDDVNFSRILSQELSNPTYLLSNGKFLNRNLLSGLTVKGLNVTARGMRLVYYMAAPNNATESDKLLSWEMRFLQKMKQIKSSLKCVSLKVLSSRSTDDDLRVLLKPNYLAAAIGVVALLFAEVGAIKLFSSSVSFLCIFLLLTILVVMSLVSSYSLTIAFDVPFLTITLVLPYLMKAKLVSDTFMLAERFKNDENVKSFEYRLSSCLAGAGPVLNVVFIVNSLAFGFVVILSTSPAINYYYSFALVGTFVSYFIFLFGLSTSVYLLRRHLFTRDSNASVPPCLEMGSRKASQTVLSKGVKLWISYLSSPFAMIAVAFFMLGSIAFGVFFTIKTSQPFDTSLKLYKDSTYLDYVRTKQEMFGHVSDVSIIFQGSIDYGSSRVQKEITKVQEVLSKASYTSETSVGWITSLNKFAKEKGRKCNGSAFQSCLFEFLTLSEHAHFADDISYEKTPKNRTVIIASRFHIMVKTGSQIFKEYETITLIKNDISQVTNLNTVIASDHFSSVETVMTFRSETFSIVILLGIWVFLNITFFTASPKSAMFVTFGLAIQVVDLFAIMSLLDVPITVISFLGLFTALVIAVSFNIKVAQAVALSSSSVMKARISDAMFLVGPAVIIGNLIGILSSIALGFVFQHLDDLFMKVIPLIFVSCFFHVILFLPGLFLIYERMELLFKCYGSSSVYPVIRKEQIVINAKHDTTRGNKARKEAIALVGIGCRFPKARNKDKFWEMLLNGVTAVGSFPENRRKIYNELSRRYYPKSQVSGTVCTLGGSFLENIKLFDANFFNISPQEAKAIDPQQRIMIEVVYEAIEDAGLKLSDLQNGKTGVFVGNMNLDFKDTMGLKSQWDTIDQFSATGIGASMISNRISFVFNLTGPSLTVDTACSSSLMALKIASDSLRNGECDIAIVCAANIVLSTAQQISLSIGGFLAPDGRCKTFDISGNGYGRGEGFAAVILKMEKGAKTDKDDAYCTVIACCTNNDGQTTVPITAPSARLQAELSKMVLEESGLSPGDVDYFEAHGTGTAIGDVVEVKSIADTYGHSSNELNGRVLRIGSVKSNINHTESASGLAGLIKIGLMMQHKMFVPTVSVKTLNPKLALGEKGLMVQDSCEQWPARDGKPRIAALNSFGYGGSNVHAIVQEFETQAPDIEQPTEDRTHYMLTLSARSEVALRQTALNHSKWFQHQAGNEDCHSLSDICYSLNERKTQHPHRIVGSFCSLLEASESLLCFAEDREGWEKVVRAHQVESGKGVHKVAFIFGGQGAMWHAVGREMIMYEALFRETIMEISALLKKAGETWSLMDELHSSEENSKLSQPSIGQPATFAIQYATAKLLKAWGIHPAAVVGHSLGEYAAACTVGAISLEEGLKLVLLRSKLHERCPGNGGMAALGMSESNAEKLLSELKLDSVLTVASVNDAESVTISGDAEAIRCVETHLKTNGMSVFWRVLPTSHAFHSNHMDCIRSAYLALIRKLSLKPQLSLVPIYSTVHGDVVSGKHLTGEYWWNNLRQPVKFYQAMKRLLQDGLRFCIEISTQPVLAHYVRRISEQEGYKDQEKAHVLPTLPKKSVTEQHKLFLLNTVGQLHIMGFPVEWHCVQGRASHQFVRSPPYPWEEQEHWGDDDVEDRLVEPLRGQDDSNLTRFHPHLGEVQGTVQFSGLCCWETDIDLYHFPWLRDHSLAQAGPVVPGALYIEMALAMATDRFLSDNVQLKSVKFINLLTLPETHIRKMRLRLQTNKEMNGGEFQITCLQHESSEMLLATGEVRVDLDGRKMATPQKRKHDKAAKKKTDNTISKGLKDIIDGMDEMSLSETELRLAKNGFDFGPCFKIMRRLWHNKEKEEGIALISMDPGLKNAEATEDYIIHPTVLDACLQTVRILAEKNSVPKVPEVPIEVGRITVFNPNVPFESFCYVRHNTEMSKTYDIILMDAQGNTHLVIEQFQTTQLNNLMAEKTLKDVSYELQWIEQPLVPPSTHINIIPKKTIYLVYKDTNGLAQSFIDQLSSKDHLIIKEIDFPKSRIFDHEVEEHIKSVICSLPNPGFPNVRIVNFWPGETFVLGHGVKVIDDCQDFVFKSSLLTVQQLVAGGTRDAQVFTITRGTQIVPQEDIGHKSSAQIPWGATAWGFKRTVPHELTSVRVSVVDLSGSHADDEIDQLVKEVTSDSKEDEVAFRRNKRFVNRLSMSNTSITDRQTYGSINCDNTRVIQFVVHPNTRQICLRTKKTTDLQKGEAEIELENICCSQDVDRSLTSEDACVAFSGKVKSVCPGSSMVLGEDVIGVVRGTQTGNRINIIESLLLRKPSELTLPQATTIPVSMAIALYAVQRLSVVESSKDLAVLIHEGNKSAGLAAICIAKALGHKVFCTTSNPDPNIKEILVRLGADGLFDNNSCYDTNLPDCVDAVLFLDRPSPGALQRSCGTLRPGGKILLACDWLQGDVFLPAGKLLSYERVSVVDVLLQPEKFQELWNLSKQLLQREGLFDALLGIKQQTTQLFDILVEVNTQGSSETTTPTKSSDASFLSFALQSGCSRLPLIAPSLDREGLKANRTYLVVGGTRGLGFEVVRWMADHHAKSIVLVGRSPPSKEKKQEVAAIERKTGAKILIHQSDVSLPEHMETLYQTLKNLPSVAGIIHSAVVFRDKIITDIKEFHDVLAPKIKGAYLLHQMSLSMDLDFFVLFSSVASIFGNAGQATYAGANAFLDSLAQYRQHVLGLPALAINWGPIEGAGILSRDSDLAEMLSSYGYNLIPATKAANYMAQILVEEPTKSQVGIFDVDWPTMDRVFPQLTNSPRMSKIHEEARAKYTETQHHSVDSFATQILLETDIKKKTEMVREMVNSIMKTWTGDMSSEIDQESSLYNYGIDSLAALTFKMKLETSLHLSFEVFYFMQPDTTISRLVSDAVSKLQEQQDVAQTQETAGNTTQPTQVNSDPNTSLVQHGHVTSGTSLMSEETTERTNAANANDVKIVPLHTPEEAMVKFFCVHPSHRYAMSLVPISMGFQFQDLVSFYAIGTTDPTIISTDWHSVRELATSYVGLIRQEQRHGPYYLGGYSYGGLVAYEMASVLKEKDEQVAFVGMIDTLPWFPQFCTATSHFTSKFKEPVTGEMQIKVQMEAAFSKMAIQNLKMSQHEYRELKQQMTWEVLIQYLSQRAQEMDIPSYDLKTLYESLVQDHVVAHRTHCEWYPAEVRYENSVSYIKAQDSKYSVSYPLLPSAEKAWGSVFEGRIIVCSSPGDHFTTIEPPYAQITGGILATSVSIRYRSLVPSVIRSGWSHRQRWAIENYAAGVRVFLHSKHGHEEPSIGVLTLEDKKQVISFQPKMAMVTRAKLNRKQIQLREIEIVLPGKHVPKAIKYANRQCEVKGLCSGNLDLVVSVITKHRAYNFECLDLKELKGFYCMIGAVLGLTLKRF